MTDILAALGTAAGLLLPIIIFVTLVAITTVKRAEAAAHRPPGAPEGHAQAVPAASESSSAVAVVPRELGVMEIILLALVLFALAMFALLGLSMVSHM